MHLLVKFLIIIIVLVKFHSAEIYTKHIYRPIVKNLYTDYDSDKAIKHFISCEVYGYPIPNITWYYQECDSNAMCATASMRKVNVSRSTIKDENLVASTFGVEINLSRRIVCVGENSFGETNSTFDIFTTSIGYHLYHLGTDSQKYIIGDNITLNYVVSADILVSSFQWVKATSNNLTEVVLESNGRIQIITRVAYKKFYIYSLIINNATFEDSGSYITNVRTIDGLFLSNSIDCSVVEGAPVFIYKSNMDNSTRQIFLNQTSTFLYCMANGEPTPTITWFKDEVNVETLLDSGRVFMEYTSNKVKILNIKKEDQGVYKCRAKNKFGMEERYVTLVLSDSNNAVYIGVISIGILLFVTVVVFLLWKSNREKRFRSEQRFRDIIAFIEGDPVAIKPDMKITQQAALLPYDRKWEFPKQNLTFKKVLGSGEFGIVMQALAKNILPNEENTLVAVKMIKSAKVSDLSCVKSLISELKIMSHLGRHLNVVNLLGACTENIMQKEIFVIVEFCWYGCLKTFISLHRSYFIDQRVNESDVLDFKIGIENIHSASESSAYDDIRENAPITTHDLLCWAFQVARGMDYLANRKILHGDLALRNILLTKNDIVKIADFGLSKNIYESGNYKAKKGGGPLPIKWMAIESLRDGVFSIQSDVWSYGIVLWELFSLANNPYMEVPIDSSFIKMILNGYRLTKPQYATDFMYTLMMECWRLNPMQRPIFIQLAEAIGSYLVHGVKQLYVTMNEPMMELNRIEKVNGRYDYLDVMAVPNYK